MLEDAGVDQFNVYLMNGDEREQLERIGREVIPALAAAGSRRVASGTGRGRRPTRPFTGARFEMDKKAKTPKKPKQNKAKTAK